MSFFDAFRDISQTLFCIQEGIQKGIISLYKKGIITLSDASKELSVSEEEFLNMLVME